VSDVEVRKKRVRELLAAITAGDEPTIRSLLTERVQMWLPQSAVSRTAMDCPLTGNMVVARVLAGTPTTFPGMTFTIRACVGEGDRVVLHAELDAHTAIGNEYHNTYLWLFRFEDDHIAEAWEYLDTAYAFERLGM
jgi:ketosteroid isomerase-like protein